MAERQAKLYDAALFRTQAISETLVRLQCEILAHLSNKPFSEISEIAWKDIDSSTNELIKMHSDLGGSPTEN